MMLFRLFGFLLFIFTNEIMQSQAADEVDDLLFFEENRELQTEIFPQSSDDEDNAPLKKNWLFPAHQSDSGLTKSDPIPIPNKLPTKIDIEFDEAVNKYQGLKKYPHQLSRRKRLNKN